MMYCSQCGNRIDNCVCGTKMRSFKSLAKSIEELKENEHFYTNQESKQVFSVVSKMKKEWQVITKKCLVVDPNTGDVLDTLTRVEKRF